MSDKDDIIGDAIERLEWDERKEDDSPFKSFRQLTRRTALTGGAAGIAALILEACGSSSSSSSSSSPTGTGTATAATSSGGSSAAAIFGDSNKYKFTLVNHVTTNPFFTPTQNGASDACKLLGCSYQWTGSQTSNVSEMVNAFNTAITAGVNGIGVPLIDLHAFNAPHRPGAAQKIPVVAYNADAAGNNRLALHRPGPVRLRPADGRAHRPAAAERRRRRAVHRHAGLAQHPAAHRRRDRHAQDAPRTSSTHVVATGADVPGELTTIQAYATANPSTKG